MGKNVIRKTTLRKLKDQPAKLFTPEEQRLIHQWMVDTYYDDLTRPEIAILEFIYKRTIQGWGKLYDIVTIQDMLDGKTSSDGRLLAEKVGYRRRTIFYALKGLDQKGILSIGKYKKSKTYAVRLEKELLMLIVSKRNTSGKMDNGELVRLLEEPNDVVFTSKNPDKTRQRNAVYTKLVVRKKGTQTPENIELSACICSGDEQVQKMHPSINIKETLKKDKNNCGLSPGGSPSAPTNVSVSSSEEEKSTPLISSSKSCHKTSAVSSPESSSPVSVSQPSTGLTTDPENGCPGSSVPSSNVNDKLDLRGGFLEAKENILREGKNATRAISEGFKTFCEGCLGGEYKPNSKNLEKFFRQVHLEVYDRLPLMAWSGKDRGLINWIVKYAKFNNSGNAEYFRFLDWVVRNWSGKLNEKFIWATKPPMPAYPAVWFLYTHLEKIICAYLGLDKHANFRKMDGKQPEGSTENSGISKEDYDNLVFEKDMLKRTINAQYIQIKNLEMKDFSTYRQSIRGLTKRIGDLEMEIKMCKTKKERQILEEDLKNASEQTKELRQIFEDMLNQYKCVIPEKNIKNKKTACVC